MYTVFFFFEAFMVVAELKQMEEAVGNVLNEVYNYFESSMM